MEDLTAAEATSPPPPPVWQMAAEHAGPARTEHRFEFSGDAREYFRIWVVNLALGIVTLGIYSAWAKVRSERYFYGNTRLAGEPFEYLAKPLPILKGRLIAVSLFAIYILAGQLSWKLQIGAAVAIALATPWLFVRGCAFRARYSAWRGINFRFEPNNRRAYAVYLLLGIPVVLSLGLMYPYVKAKQKAFFVEHHRYGGIAFTFRATPGQFYPPYLIAGGVTVAIVFALSLLLGAIAALVVGVSHDGPPAWFMYAYIVPFYASYFAVWVFLAAALSNLLYNHTDLGPHGFRSTLEGRKLLWIYAGNTAAILASAGFMIPWAKVRLARYRAENLVVLSAGDLDDFRAESRADIGAAAAEMDGLFDIDIGL
ncbi:MAG: YjgN family protein [Rhodanobacteraceae bacterium]